MMENLRKHFSQPPKKYIKKKKNEEYLQKDLAGIWVPGKNKNNKWFYIIQNKKKKKK